MKKILVSLFSAFLMAGCSDKNAYEQVVLEKIQADKDIQDYKIDPQTMAKCVVDMTSKKMPGFFPLDPERMTAYQNYAKMLTMTEADDPAKTLTELREKFGSPKALAEANRNYNEGVLSCMAALVNKD